MATTDVPGSNPANGDRLAMGCWAEHNDGSMIFVEGVDEERVIYSIFDMSKAPVVEYRSAMSITAFKTQFTWHGGKTNKWVWHDKTPFPWDRIIRGGLQDGTMKYASVEDQLSVAQRVAESLSLHGMTLTEDRLRALAPEKRDEITKLLTNIDNILSGNGAVIGNA